LHLHRKDGKRGFSLSRDPPISTVVCKRAYRPSIAGFHLARRRDSPAEVLMPGGFITQCPACSTKLKLKEKPPQGKKLRCPKCSAVFAPPGGYGKSTPKPKFDEFGPLDESSASVDPFDEPLQGRRLPGRVGVPRRATKAPSRREVEEEAPAEDAPPGKSRQAGESTNRAVLILVGSGAFCVLLCAGGLPSSSFLVVRDFWPRWPGAAARAFRQSICRTLPRL
jgi:predicted Zn finger-like uncharacterized protein